MHAGGQLHCSCFPSATLEDCPSLHMTGEEGQPRHACPYTQPHLGRFEKALGDANHVFTALFCAELAIKGLGLGLWTSRTDYWNPFDAVVVAFRSG